MFHYKFVAIHPFDDGNGRMARILLNYVLMAEGYPPVIIPTSEKSTYLLALEQADAGNIEPFNLFVGQQLIHSLELYIHA